MTDRLPPLTALRAFDAAARHMSFAKAAEELNVTPGALSFQMKSLEEHLGTPLFHRFNRAVELTEAGKILAPWAKSGFEDLQQGWNAAKRQINRNQLTITAGPAFTSLWLAPRLFDFATEHPEIELNFKASLRLLDFKHDDIDIAIRIGEAPDEGLFCKELIREWVTPMMSPALAQKYPKLSDLKNAPLLREKSFPFVKGILDWQKFFDITGLGQAPENGPSFSHADQSTNAAIAGTGVFLGRGSLTEGALKAGTLVAPYANAIRLPYRYRLLYPEAAKERPQVIAFTSWIEQQVAAMHCYEDQFEFIEI